MGDLSRSTMAEGAGSTGRGRSVSCPRRSGWLATAGVFVLMAVVNGPLYNYSILFVSLQDEFGATAAVTGEYGIPEAWSTHKRTSIA